jgi:hypothetical protein
MKSTLFLFILLVHSTINGQNQISFRNLLNEGNYWFYEAKYDSAFVYYSKAETFNIPLFPEEVHTFSRTLWEIGNKKKAIDVLIAHDGIKDFFLKDTSYYEGMSFNERQKIATLLKKTELDLLSEYMPFYENLHSKDQMYRQVFMNYADGTVQKDSIRKLMVYQDSLNFLALIEEIKLHGYPGGYTMAPVGPGAILLHAKSEWIINNYSVFRKEIEAGRMSCFDFSKAMDRMFVNDAKQSPYNSYLPLEENEVGSPIFVFVNRCSIGMSPYYDVYIPRLYPRGKTPPKSKLYDYYKRSKEKYNCTTIE